jgi:hypothetical protein
MDRHDEAKRTGTVEPREPADDRQTGDVLGVGHVVERDPRAPHATDDPEDVRRRRPLALGKDEPETPRPAGELEQGKGATGVDLGAAGPATETRDE